MGLLLDPHEEAQRASFVTTTSTCCSVKSSSTDFSRMSAYTYEPTTSTTSGLRLTETIFEDQEVDDSVSQKQLQAQLFPLASIRVLKQTPLPDWLKVFTPRIVRLQAGPVPYMEYARSEHGEIRQRKMLSVWTRVERQTKNKLLIDFQEPEVNGKKNSTKNGGEWYNSDKWVLRFETKQERDVWAKKIQDAVELLSWINKFTLGNVIMSSEHSTVTECFSWMDAARPSYVFKTMDVDNSKRGHGARNEVNVHQALSNYANHPNIVHLHDAFRQKEKAYIIMENCAGGDLYEFLSHHGAMEEQNARVLFRHIADAVSFIHEQNIIHLDIKPENLFFKTSALQLEGIKLGDFGSAHYQGDANPALSCTIGYAAPEVLEHGEISFAADVFGAGAVLYTVLCGYSPFAAPSDEEMLEKTLLGEIVFDEEDWAHVSDCAKSLVRGMLQFDPKLRMSMDEVLDHAWLQL